MHNRIANRAEALIGILRGNLMYQNIGFTTYPGYSLPLRDLDTNHALNLCYNFQRTDLLASLHHSPFTIYTMVSYMLSNTHMVDKFLNKEDIEIDDIFTDVCAIQNVSHSCILSYIRIGKSISNKSLSLINGLASLDNTQSTVQPLDSILHIT